MSFPLLLYRLSGWSQDIIWLMVCWYALRRMYFWREHYRYFLIYLLIITFLELVYTITALLMANNLFLNYIYSSVEFIFLGMFLRGVIGKKLFVGKSILFVSIVFIIFQIYNAFWGEGLKSSNAYGGAINGIYLITLSLWAFTVIFTQSTFKNIRYQPTYWLVLGILLIYLTDLLVDFMSKLGYIHGSDNMLYAFYITRNFLKSCYILLFLRGIFYIQRS